MSALVPRDARAPVGKATQRRQVPKPATKCNSSAKISPRHRRLFSTALTQFGCGNMNCKGCYASVRPVSTSQVASHFLSSPEIRQWTHSSTIIPHVSAQSYHRSDRPSAFVPRVARVSSAGRYKTTAPHRTNADSVCEGDPMNHHIRDRNYQVRTAGAHRRQRRLAFCERLGCYGAAHEEEAGRTLGCFCSLSRSLSRLQC